VSDRALRQLERRWRVSGTVEDERAFRLAQVRGGVWSARELGLLRLRILIGDDGTAISRLLDEDPLSGFDISRGGIHLTAQPGLGVALR